MVLKLFQKQNGRFVTSQHGNLLKFSVERSPFAPALKGWRADFTAGGARRDMAIARMSVGTGFGYAFYEAARNGVLTGSELRRLVRDVLPQASEGQLRYFAVRQRR